MKAYRLLCVLLLAGSAAGCNEITGNDGNFVFDFLPLTWEPSLQDTAEALPTTRGIQVNGVIILPQPCYGLEGRHDISGGRITMTVRATRIGQGCPAVLDAASYRFQNFGLRAGVYRVQVVHAVQDAQSEVVLEEDVVVN